MSTTKKDFHSKGLAEAIRARELAEEEEEDDCSSDGWSSSGGFSPKNQNINILTAESAHMQQMSSSSAEEYKPEGNLKFSPTTSFRDTLHINEIHQGSSEFITKQQTPTVSDSSEQINQIPDLKAIVSDADARVEKHQVSKSDESLEHTSERASTRQKKSEPDKIVPSSTASSKSTNRVSSNSWMKTTSQQEESTPTSQRPQSGTFVDEDLFKAARLRRERIAQEEAERRKAKEMERLKSQQDRRRELQMLQQQSIPGQASALRQPDELTQQDVEDEALRIAREKRSVARLSGRFVSPHADYVPKPSPFAGSGTRTSDLRKTYKSCAVDLKREASEGQNTTDAEESAGGQTDPKGQDGAKTDVISSEATQEHIPSGSERGDKAKEEQQAGNPTTDAESAGGVMDGTVPVSEEGENDNDTGDEVDDASEDPFESPTKLDHSERVESNKDAGDEVDDASEDPFESPKKLDHSEEYNPINAEHAKEIFEPVAASPELAQEDQETLGDVFSINTPAPIAGERVLHNESKSSQSLDTDGELSTVLSTSTPPGVPESPSNIGSTNIEPTNVRNLSNTRCVAMHDYSSSTQDGVLKFCKGDIIEVIDQCDEHWWNAKIGDEHGLVPDTYIAPMEDTNVNDETNASSLEFAFPDEATEQNETPPQDSNELQTSDSGEQARASKVFSSEDIESVGIKVSDSDSQQCVDNTSSSVEIQPVHHQNGNEVVEPSTKDSEQASGDAAAITETNQHWNKEATADVQQVVEESELSTDTNGELLNTNLIEDGTQSTYPDVAGKASVESRTPPPEKMMKDGDSNMNFVVALYDYEAQEPEDLGFLEGDVIQIIEKLDEEWMNGKNMRTSLRGVLPCSYVTTKDSKDASATAVAKNVDGITPEEPVTDSVVEDHVSANRNGNNHTVNGQDNEVMESKEDPEKEEHVDTKGFWAIGLYDFDSADAEAGELKFAAGDRLFVQEQIDENWWKGYREVNENAVGIFPCSYAQPLGAPAAESNVVYQEDNEIGKEVFFALYDFTSDVADDLNFKQGDRIVVNRHVDADWCIGQLGDKQGLVPVQYLAREDEEEDEGDV